MNRATDAIREISEPQIESAAKDIRGSFASLAKQFNITPETCPGASNFITAEHLKEHFERGLMMFGLGDPLIGFAALEMKTDTVYKIRYLSVLPEHRHKGYGKKLLSYCINKVIKLNGSKIEIGIIEENTVLKNWYAANGFIHTGTEKFEHLPFTVGYMELNL
jgi:GNAT superfamily N-acetyltransferase